MNRSERLTCAECGRRSDDRAQRWRAYLCGGYNGERSEVVTFCPTCAAREFLKPGRR